MSSRSAELHIGHVRRPAPGEWLIVGILVMSIALWMLSLPRIDLDAMNDTGLVSVLPLMAFASLVLLAGGFVASVFRRRLRGWLWKSYIVTFIVLLHGTPALLYGTLRYPWGWKHIGVVDYILRHGTVDPNAAILDVYHNWPGFFGLNAFLTKAAGLETPLSYASWSPLFFNLATFVVLLVLIRTLTDDQRLVALALWFYFLTPWVGQDYFAPQALAFVLYLVIITTVLLWRRPTSFDRVGGRAPPQISLLGKFETLDEHYGRLALRQRAGHVVFVLLVMFVIASSHQLTSPMVVIALTALALAGVERRWWLPALMVDITFVWATSGAHSFVQRNLDELGETGRVVGNVQGSLVDLNQVSSGQVLVSWMSRGLTLLIVLLALAGLVRSYRRGEQRRAATVLMVAPVVLVALSSYGTEILFRIYLFALPFAAFLAAVLFLPDKDTGRRMRTRIAALGISLLLLTGFLFAYYGNEQLNYFTHDEVAAADYLYETAPAGSLIVEGSRNYPSLFRNQEQFVFVPIAREPWETRLDLASDPVPRLSQWLTDNRYPDSYLIITRSQKLQTDSQGQMPPGGLAAIESALLDSPQFKVWFSNKDATIFVAAGQGTGS